MLRHASYFLAFIFLASTTSAQSASALKPEEIISLPNYEAHVKLLPLWNVPNFMQFVELVDTARELHLLDMRGHMATEVLVGHFNVHYGALNSEGRQEVKAMISAIAALHPDKFTLRALHAECLIIDAFAARGGEELGSIDEESKQIFRENMAEAAAILKSVRDEFPMDTQPLAGLVRASFGSNQSNLNYFMIGNRALAIRPFSPLVIRLIVDTFCSNEPAYGKDIKRLAEWSAMQTRDDIGDAMYAFVAQEAAKNLGVIALVERLHFDPTRLFAAARDYERHISSAPMISHTVLFTACAADLKEEAKTRFATSTYDDSVDEIWTYAQYDAWRTWALEDARRPLAVRHLHLAARAGETERLARLLSEGADINAVNANGVTALLEACLNEQWDSAQFLVSAGADPDLCAWRLWPPLLLAAAFGQYELVDAILDAGGDPNISTYGSRYPLLAAAHHGHRDIVKRLLEDPETDVDLTNEPDFRFPLMAAIVSSNIECAEMLISAGANLDLRHASGWTPLTLATSYGFDRLTRMLADHGADATIPGVQGWAPLTMAMAKKNWEIADYLLTLPGVDINQPSPTGYRPIHQITRNGDPEILGYVLSQQGIEIDAQVPFTGETPLNIAARMGSLENVKMLLAIGADAALTNNRGQSPLDIAKERGHADIVALLTP